LKTNFDDTEFHKTWLTSQICEHRKWPKGSERILSVLTLAKAKDKKNFAEEHATSIFRIQKLSGR